MKLESFFEKFELFAAGPGAVAKLRELVLLLAFEGKVVDQDGSEESGHDLLNRMIIDRERLIANREIKNAKIRISPKNLFQPDLPDSWCMTTLGVIGDWGSGSTPKRSNPEYYGGDIMWLKSGELNDCESLAVSAEAITQVALKSGSFRRNQVGDVLIAMYGATIGKVAILAEPAVTNQAVCGCSPLDGVSNRFLFYYLLSQRKSFHAASEGGAQPNISKVKLLAYPFPLPPLAEQKRIVAKVDALMALCDLLEAQQQEREKRHAALARASLARFADAPTPANLQFLFHKSYDIDPADLRKAILTLAVQGKLVPQDPNDEPAGELLKKVAKQRTKLLFSGSIRKTKPCRQFVADEEPYGIPKTWSWTMLGEITDIGTGSTPLRTESSFWNNGTIPWITSGSTSRAQISRGDELVTPLAVKVHRLRIYPPGTLLVALYGQGKTRGQVAELNIPATINQACAAICPLDGIPSMQGYLKVLLEKQYDEMRSMSAGGAQPNLNVQKIKETFVSLPPLAEQRRIVAKVDQLMALVDTLEAQIAASRATAKNLLDALVAELTAAGPT